MADDIKSVLLRFTGDSDDAEGDIVALMSLLAALDGVDVDAEAHVATASGKKNVLELMAALSVLDNTDVNVDVQFNEGHLERQNRLLSLLSRGWLNLGDTVEGVGGQMGHLVVRFGPLHGALNLTNVAVLAVAAALAVTLVGALGAVVASLAAAVAGIAALATALAAALGPAVLLAVAVIARLAAIWKVLKQEEQAQLQEQQKQIQGEQTRVASMERRAAAAEQLKRAQEDLGRAAAAAYLEMENAAEDATDAILALERAQLSEEQAALNIRQSKFELKKFREELKLTGKEIDTTFNKFTDVAFDPSKLNKELGKIKTPEGKGISEENQLKLEQLILDVRDARLSEKEATDAVSDAVRNKTRAEQRHLEFVQKGIKASPQYVSALRAVEDAHKAVAVAAKDPAISAALAMAQAQADKLSDKERVLLGILRQVKKDFTDTFGPATDAIITGIGGGILIISKRVRGLKRQFTTLGETIAGSIVAAADQLTSDQMLANFKAFIEGATILVPPFTQILVSLFTILANIANAALPFLVVMVNRVAGAFSGWADSSSDISRIRDIIAVLVQHFLAWWNVFKVFGALFLEFFRQAAPFGLQIANAIAKAAQGMLDWMKSEKGRAEIKQFLETAVPFAGKLATAIGKIVLFLVRVGEIAAPILGPLITLFGTLLDINTKLLHVVGQISKVIGDVAQFFADIVNDILGTLASFIDNFVQIGVDWVAGIIKGIGKEAKKLLDKAAGIGKDVLHALSHPWEIGSPSRVTEGYAKNLVEGLIKGMEGAAGKLSTAVDMHLVAPVLDTGSLMAPAGKAAGKAAAATAGGGGSGDIIIEKQTIDMGQVAGGGLADPRAAGVQLLAELTRSARRVRR